MTVLSEHGDLKDGDLVRRMTQMIESPLGDDLVMMSIEEGQYYSLNDTAGLIWQSLAASPKTVAELCAAVQDEYDVDAAQCRTTVTAFVQHLVRENMVEVSPA